MKTNYRGHDQAYQSRKANGFPGWSENTAEYESTLIRIKGVIQEHGIPTTGKLLELGCGAGNTTLDLAELGYQISGIDISPTAIEWAQELAREREIDANFRVGDVV